MSKINKVLYNVDQRDSSKGTVNTREEMWMARNNIGLDEVIGHATVTENDKEYKGIAPLGTNGLVPAEFLPSFVNAVVNGYYYNGKFYREAAHTTEISPDANTTYVDITVADVGVGYRWTQASGYFQISSQNAFGALSDGTNSIHADQPMDLLTITGQSGVTVSVGDSSHSDTLTIGHSNSVTSDYIGEKNPTTTISNTFNLPWAHYDGQGHITESGSNAITIQSATTAQVGVTQLVSTAGTGEDKAVTQKGVQAAIDQLNATQSDTGTNVSVTVVEEKGKLKSVTVTDDTAKAVHAHGNITSDGKVTTAAASKKAMLITNSSDQVVVGPAFGTETGDDNLFLNKNGNWIVVNTRGASAYVDSYGSKGLVTLYVTSGTNVGGWSTFASGLKSTYVSGGGNMMQVDAAGGLYVDANTSSSNFGKLCVYSGNGLGLDSSYRLEVKVNNGLYIDPSNPSKGIGLIMSNEYYSGSGSIAWNFDSQCFWFNKPSLYVNTTPTAYVQSNVDTTNSDTYLQFNPGCYSGSSTSNDRGERSFVKFTGTNGITVSSVADTTNHSLSTITFDLGEATSSARGGIKIGYTQSGKNYPVQLSSGKAYVNVPWSNDDTKNTVGIGNDSSMEPSGGQSTPKGAVFPFVDSSATGSSARSYTTHGSNSRALLEVEESMDTSSFVLVFDGGVVPTVAANVQQDALLTYNDINGTLVSAYQCGSKYEPIYLNEDGVPVSCGNKTNVTYTYSAGSRPTITSAKVLDISRNTYAISATYDPDESSVYLGNITPPTSASTKNKILKDCNSGGMKWVWNDAEPTFAKYDLASSSSSTMYINNDILPSSYVSSYLCGYISSMTTTDTTGTSIICVPPHHRGSAHCVISGSSQGQSSQGSTSWIRFYLTDTQDPSAEPSTFGTSALWHGNGVWLSGYTMDYQHASFIYRNDGDQSKYITCFIGSSSPPASFSIYKEFEMFPTE